MTIAVIAVVIAYLLEAPSTVPRKGSSVADTSIEAGVPIPASNSNPLDMSSLGVRVSEEQKTLRDRVHSAPNLRAFVHEALQKPAEGGYYFAIQVVLYCRGVDGLRESGKVVYKADRELAFQAIRAEFDRCEGVVDQVDSPDALVSNVKSRGDYGQDPLRLVHDNIERKQYTSGDEAISAALGTGEPLLFGAALFGYVKEIIEKQANRKFNWTTELHSLAISAATAILIRDPAYPRDKAWVAALCLMEGDCDRQSHDYVESVIDENQRQVYEYFKSLLSAYVSGVRQIHRT